MCAVKRSVDVNRTTPTNGDFDLIKPFDYIQLKLNYNIDRESHDKLKNMSSEIESQVSCEFLNHSTHDNTKNIFTRPKNGISLIRFEPL